MPSRKRADTLGLTQAELQWLSVLLGGFGDELTIPFHAERHPLWRISLRQRQRGCARVWRPLNLSLGYGLAAPLV